MNECVWKDFLENEFKQEYFRSLSAFLKEEYRTRTIYPVREDVFNAFEYTPYETCKVVILGQDPYHEPNQAHGLCFSVKPGIEIPPSLENIYKEFEEYINDEASNFVVDEIYAGGELDKEKYLNEFDNFITFNLRENDINEYDFDFNESTDSRKLNEFNNNRFSKVVDKNIFLEFLVKILRISICSSLGISSVK